MSLNRKSLESLVLVSGILVFLLFLLIPQPERPVTYWSTLSEASRTLKGQGAPSDLTQDIVGFRALLNRKDPYPIFALGVKELGLEWGVDHASTHPPMAFLHEEPLLPHGNALRQPRLAFYATILIQLTVHNLHLSNVAIH